MALKLKNTAYQLLAVAVLVCALFTTAQYTTNHSDDIQFVCGCAGDTIFPG